MRGGRASPKFATSGTSELRLLRESPTTRCPFGLPNGHDNLRRLSEAQSPSGSSCCYAFAFAAAHLTPALSSLKRCLGLPQPETHIHLAVHLCRSGEMLLGLCCVARAAIQRAEAEVAVGDERAHVAFGSQRHGGAEVRLRGGDDKSSRMGGDLAKDAESPGFIGALASLTSQLHGPVGGGPGVLDLVCEKEIGR